ncbi:hypothetical protein ACVI1J_004946 [Bradyrhizobium diazoefficiens]
MEHPGKTMRLINDWKKIKVLGNKPLQARFSPHQIDPLKTAEIRHFLSAPVSACGKVVARPLHDSADRRKI